MMSIVKRHIPNQFKLLVNWLIHCFTFDFFMIQSYSQEAEDVILKRLFEGQKTGFYIDVGAHHPSRYSNTNLFYKMGWSGINIDAMPGSMALFKRFRPRDINLEIAVAKEKKKLTFYIFNDPALNTFDEELSRRRNCGSYYVVQKQLLQTCPLAEVLSEHIPNGQEIDFMSIDVEGYDLEALQSNDWEHFRPKYILVECLGASLEAIHTNAIYRYLKDKHYQCCAKTVNTFIFERYIP